MAMAGGKEERSKAEASTDRRLTGLAAGGERKLWAKKQSICPGCSQLLTQRPQRWGGGVGGQQGQNDPQTGTNALN